MHRARVRAPAGKRGRQVAGMPPPTHAGEEGPTVTPSRAFPPEVTVLPTSREKGGRLRVDLLSPI